MVGRVGVGAHHPLRVQSMTTSITHDIAATVRQSIALAEAGCEIVRITAPNVSAARCLKSIRAELDAAGYSDIPLVADIHFLPSAAMEAVEHVEKVRINPGNYADKKKFAVREYSDSAYDEEIDRLHQSFSPLVKRCKALGRSMRIGTNHGSLSDRIMNRYGDSPLGMVESALEFLRIAESHDYRAIILSMKASNPKVMIEAYRMLVQRMADESMHYPLHLGVTEAGDGEDGRIKSAIGIGSLLMDGLGDTIRVSLTEDAVYEIPVAQAIARKAMSAWQSETVPANQFPLDPPDAIDPFHFNRREIASFNLGGESNLGSTQPPRVITRAPSVADLVNFDRSLDNPTLKENPPEGIVVSINSAPELEDLKKLIPLRHSQFLILELDPAVVAAEVEPILSQSVQPLVLLRHFTADSGPALEAWLALCRAHPTHTLGLTVTAEDFTSLAPIVSAANTVRIIATVPAQTAPPSAPEHIIGTYRRLADALNTSDARLPLWIRNTAHTAWTGDKSFLTRLLDASILSGTLLCDGLGDLISLETETDAPRAVKLAYNVLQGAGARITKTEFVACPSCGRTLFDLQTTTQRIRAKTGHLKGVKIAIMGCIVNGPGEMADADFGYVGGAPAKINLYVGKTCVQYNIPQKDADEKLIGLIREHGKWIEPDAENSA